MSDRPYVICHMLSSIDGGLHPSRYTVSPNGAAKDWSRISERLHDEFDGRAWLVGRATMAEIAKGEPHPPAEFKVVDRSTSFADRDAHRFAIAVDTRGELHFRSAQIGGDHVVVLLGGSVSDEHLAELAGDGISYIVSENDTVDLAKALVKLRRDFGVQRLLLEGGAAINGAFLGAGLVDELSVVLAPALDAREGMETIVSTGPDGLRGKVELSLRSCSVLENGLVHLRYDVS